MSWTAVTTVAAMGVILLTWRFYRVQMKRTSEVTDPYNRLTAQLEIHKLSGQVIAAAAVGTGLVLSWLQFGEAREQFRNTLAEQKEEIRLSRQALELSQATQQVEQFHRALTNMSSDDATVRTAGILALDELGTEYGDRYRRSAKQLIVAFVKRQASERAYQQRAAPDTWPPPDINVALLALVHLHTPAEREKLRLGPLCFRSGDMVESNISNIDLSGATFDGADLSRSVLTGTRLHRASLVGAILEATDLADAHLENADLRGANLIGANATRASFDHARLGSARLSVANLSNASLQGADLRQARLIGTKLSGARLAGVDLRSAEFLTQAQIEEALGDATTRLPPTLRRPNAWPSQALAMKNDQHPVEEEKR